MKKFFLIFAAVVFFGLTANAGVVFRSTQKVCYNEGMIVFKSNGIVEFWEDGRKSGTGSYTIAGKVIIIDDEMRLSANHNGQTLYNVTFRGTTFRKCN